MIENPQFNNFNKFTENGRFAGVRLKSEKDAMRILLDKVKLNLPSTGGSKKVVILPGELLKKYLEDFK